MPLFRAPPLLMQYTQEPCLVIVDTGCQRQVAGKMWHNAHSKQISLPRLHFAERCQFRFGPSASSTSLDRFGYPVGIGEHFAVMFFSCVDADAPALMSRQTLTTLDAIPDISAGKMHYRALQATSPLYLSSCGHLAVRLDEWPSVMPDWPCELPVNHANLPDIWAPTAHAVQAQALPAARHPAVHPPGNVQSTPAEMAEALATDSREPFRLDQERVPLSAPLCGDQSSQPPSRQDPSRFHDSQHSHNGADYDGCHDSAVIPEPDRVCQETGTMRTSTGVSHLRGGRLLDQDLRPVRVGQFFIKGNFGQSHPRRPLKPRHRWGYQRHHPKEKPKLRPSQGHHLLVGYLLRLPFRTLLGHNHHRRDPT